MKPTPKGWPRLSSSIFYNDAAKAIDWLCEAFGFEVRLKVEGEGGVIVHSELTFGDSLMMIGQSPEKDTPVRPGRERWPAMQSPKNVGGANTQMLMLFVDDVDVHCAQARAAGAAIIDEPKVHDYGDEYWADRSYGAVDPDGHMWWFTQRIRDGNKS
jgi:uncharacterized glyoxalase superfamily protein PhnB